MDRYFKTFVLAMAFLWGGITEMTAQDSRQLSTDSAYLCQTFSAIDVLTLGKMNEAADTYKDLPGHTAYKEKLANVTKDFEVYDAAVKALDSPFDFNRIVEVRKMLIPLITEEGHFSEAQQAEMDRLDILLSRYKGSVVLFRGIIDRINNDPVVKSYRAASRGGHPSAEDRRKYIAAISAVVYKPSSKEFTEEINNYIQLIPYLKPRLTEYLNSIAAHPESTPAVEAEIMGIRL